MNDGFEVDAERLAGHAGQFDGLVSRLSAVHRTLADALAAEGQCWGGDAVGQSFSAVHASAADSTVGRLAGLPSQVGSVGTRLGDTAVTYQGGDDAAVSHVNAAEQ
jgi:uncharacterized protein YukE